MPRKISKKHARVVQETVAVLQDGGLVVFPSETCYGIAADATNQKAVDLLQSYKSRREGKPLSVAVSDIEMAEKYADLNEIAKNIYKNYLPGPITVVSKGRHTLAQGVESEYGTLGIRIPDYPLVLDIIRALGSPITATSANMSYKPRPYSIEQLLKHTPKKQLDKIDLIIDAGKLPHNEVSTIVDTTLNSKNILRQGKFRLGSEDDVVAEAETGSPEDTSQLGSTLIQKFSSMLPHNTIIIAAGGELGSGKTQMAKGVARALGISDLVRSPTFNIVREYPFQKYRTESKFIHVDTWRLSDEKDLSSLNLEQYLAPGNVIYIEWADKFHRTIEKLFSAPSAIFLRAELSHIAEGRRKIVVTSAKQF